MLFGLWLLCLRRGGSNTEGRYYLGGTDLFLVLELFLIFFTLGETQRLIVRARLAEPEPERAASQARAVRPCRRRRACRIRPSPRESIQLKREV